tara:strand:- start:2010 stop:2213 length:204 start_codon:yes stop_codon:yes gene_type:complete
VKIDKAREFAEDLEHFEHLPKADKVMQEAYLTLKSSTKRVRHASSRKDMMLANKIEQAIKRREQNER